MNLKITSTDDHTAEIAFIPLEKLVAWKDNPRKTGRDKGMDELCASIMAHGLLQSLVVTRPDEDGNALVIAGERRLKALNRLADEGKISRRAGIACRVAEEDRDINELALAENTVREAMHPADQFEAFMKLFRSGKSVADIAGDYGVSETVVKQRMKLASVCPDVMQAYRDGKINLDQAQGFTITKNYDDQERVLAQLLDEYDPDDKWADHEDWDGAAIRGRLTEKDITADHHHVHYVTLEAYEAAGGTVTRDLFSADPKNILIDHPKILDDLVQEKITASLAQLKEQGWNWVEYRKSFDYGDRRDFILLDTDDCGTPEQRAEWERLQQLYDEVEERWEESELEDDDPELEKLANRMTEIEEEQDTLKRQIDGQFSAEVKALAGAVLTIDHRGREDVTYVIHRDNKEQLNRIRAGETVSVNNATSGEDGEEEGGTQPQRPKEPETVKLPHSLIETLTAHKSAAIGYALTQSPHLALVSVVYALARRVFPDFATDHCAVDIRPDKTSYPGRWCREKGQCEGVDRLEAREEELAGLLTRSDDRLSLWYWLLGMTQQGLLDILALCAGRCVDTVVRQHAANHDGVAHGNALAQSLNLDMTTFFTPTAENYFSLVSKETILSDLREALQRDELEPAITNLKKADLVQRAEREVAGTGWLPAPLRIPLPGQDQEA